MSVVDIVCMCVFGIGKGGGGRTRVTGMQRDIWSGQDGDAIREAC